MCSTGQLYLSKISDKILQAWAVQDATYRMWILIKWSQLCWVLHPWQSTRYRWCILASSQSVSDSHPEWLDTNTECRLLDMRIWWCVTSFAVSDRTMGAIVWQIWHEALVRLSRHNKTGSTFFGKRYQLGYRWHDITVSVHSHWWHCIPASWHFAVHPHLPTQERKWQLAWLWHVWYMWWKI